MIDEALMAAMGAAVEAQAWRSAFRRGATWRPGEPLRLLLAGYNGSRNTGADVRVHELVRQVQHLIGPRHVHLAVTTLDPARSHGLFPGARQLHLSARGFVGQLPGWVHERHGVLACEGSMFKSGFANALSAMMAGAMGLAAAEGKPAVAVGAEAGAMDAPLERLVRRACGDVYALPRTVESLERVRGLGIRADRGTDTAWTLEVPAGLGPDVLRAHGWDGRAPVLVLCPVNPFWWPVRPDPVRAAALQLTGRSSEDHARSVYFHRSGPDVDARLDAYLDALAAAARSWTGFRVVVGMEALDRRACEGLAARLGGAPNLVSDAHTWPTLVAVLRQASLVVSSRYHALVCSMPAGVPSIGVGHDERIPNLLRERGTPDLALDASDPELAGRLIDAMAAVRADGGATADASARCAAANVLRMGEMGRLLLAELRRHHPELPGVRSTDPLAHLPPLGQALERLIEVAA